MKTIAIGDIHGRTIWKKIIKQEHDADKYIFIGDYFDTHENITAEVQIINFENIISYKKKFPDKVTLLFGNHDFHYMKCAGKDEQYSGYQRKHRKEIQNKLEEAISENLLQVCCVHDEFLFSHAGVTKTWCQNNKVDLNDIENSVNKLFTDSTIININKLFSPFNFTFGNNLSYTGDDVTQSPIWVRPSSLLKDKVDNFIHVVGHTQFTKLVIVEDRDVIFIDCLGYSREYLQIIDGKINIVSIPKIKKSKKDINND